MKEQVLAFFSDLYESGQIIDYSQNGDIEQDIIEGPCRSTEELCLELPTDDDDSCYGLWVWEGTVGFNQAVEDIEYSGDWRRLTPEEIVTLVKGSRVVSDLPKDVQEEAVVN